MRVTLVIRPSLMSGFTCRLRNLRPSESLQSLPTNSRADMGQLHENNGSNTPRVAVIGAGPGGLATAMMLAASGVSVRLYEAQSTIGGRSARISLGDYHFDCGPTFFMMPYVLEEIFHAAGRRLADEVDLQRLDPMYRLVFGRNDESPLRIDTTQDLNAMSHRLAAIEPSDGPAFERFIKDNRSKLRAMTPILRSPMRSVMDLLNRHALRCGPVLKPHQSLYKYLSSYFTHPDIRIAMGFQSKYLGMSPFECPSLFSILPFIEYEYGIWHPRGGCNALMSAMHRVCTTMGVEIVLDGPVEKLHFDGRQFRGVEVHGELHRHEHVVINADATWAMKHLIPHSLRGSMSNQAIDAQRYSCSTYMLYLGVRGHVDLPHHTIYVSGDYESNLTDITSKGRLSDDPSIYVCNPSPIDSGLAPSGNSSLYVLVPTPNTKAKIDWGAQSPVVRQCALKQIADKLGIDDLDQRIVVEQSITPDDWRAMRINHGATFNLAHTLRQMLHRRPQHRMRNVDGVWFVGGGTHPGSGLPVIFLSSQITTRLLCDELGTPCSLDRAPHTFTAEPMAFDTNAA